MAGLVFLALVLAGCGRGGSQTQGVKDEHLRHQLTDMAARVKQRGELAKVSAELNALLAVEKSRVSPDQQAKLENAKALLSKASEASRNLRMTADGTKEDAYLQTFMQAVVESQSALTEAAKTF